MDSCSKRKLQHRSHLYVQRVESLAGVVSNRIPRVARSPLLDPDEEAVDGEDASLQALFVCGVELVGHGLELCDVVPREIYGVGGILGVIALLLLARTS